MAKLTKSQFMATFGEFLGVSKKEAAEKWDQFVALAIKEVKENGEFPLPGLGKLVRKERAARMGRNPMTGESISIPAKTVVKFRVAKAAKEAVL
ncbi:HU family DNA-binding protein [Candidatus Uhrbacteria bacterium]|jgi:DNA-binding protein HU-beta|nr:HU family DNA-binding protein [Candidatus Uhrbacteria bacterium]